MQEGPLVSVITCFFNEEKFIGETVQSVLKQTYSNWELILVDDGSYDQSTAIAKAYAQQFPAKIYYLQHSGHSNKGLSASRNFGISHARGEYIALLDADDVWLPEKLASQVSTFVKNREATVLLEASSYWYSWQNPDDDDVVIPIGVKPEKLYGPPELLLQLYPLGSGAAPCPSGIMLKRSVLEKINFEESFRGIYQMYEDQAFLCKVYLTEKVFVSSISHNLYRQRPASLVSSVHSTGQYDKVRQFYLEWFKKYLAEQRFNHPEVKRLLDKSLMQYHRPLAYKFIHQLPGQIQRKTSTFFGKLLNK